MRELNRGFGIIMALAVIFLGMLMFSGCLSFKKKGTDVDMLERGQRICEDTGGSWVDYRCVYPGWPRDTTSVPIDTISG